jgi:hypothetical protein
MDVDLYIDSVYHGFYPMEYIEERFSEYKQLAEEAVDEIEDDEVIVYAVFKYERDSEKILYANLMTVKMTYQEYTEICLEDKEYRRYFFLKRGREQNE